MAATTITVIEGTKIDRLNDLHHRCERTYGEALELAVEAGRMLAQIKEELRHGAFGPWLEVHFDGSDRTAQRYMQLAAAAEEDPDRIVGPSLSQAREQVARPRKMSTSEMGDAFRSAGVTSQPATSPAGNATSTDLVAAAPTRDRKDQRASVLLGEARDAYEEAHRAGLASAAIARAYRDAAVKAQRAATLLDELAILYER